MPLLLPRTGLDFSQSRPCHHHLDIWVILDTCTESRKKSKVMIMSYLSYYTQNRQARQRIELFPMIVLLLIQLGYMDLTLNSTSIRPWTFKLMAKSSQFLCPQSEWITFTHVNLQDPLLFFNHASGNVLLKRSRCQRMVPDAFPCFQTKYILYSKSLCTFNRCIITT